MNESQIAPELKDLKEDFEEQKAQSAIVEAQSKEVSQDSSQVDQEKVDVPQDKVSDAPSTSINEDIATLSDSKSEQNPMRKIFIEKVVLSSGATGPDLEKAKKLLELLSKRKAQIITSTKRIPDFGVRPGLEVGTRVTLRNEVALKILKQLLGANENTIYEDQVSENHFSFGIKEYIEIPDIEYQREIGIRGLNVTVVFARPGLKVKRKKIKRGHIPKKQHVSPEEIIEFMKQNFNTEFI